MIRFSLTAAGEQKNLHVHAFVDFVAYAIVLGLIYHFFLIARVHI